ncbi:MAG: hypothetical protein PPP58_06600 [Natronomonas sp.]
MGDTITCPECGDEAESMEELEAAHKREIPEFDADEDGEFNLFGKKDLFLCKSCRNPLGVRRN